MNKLTKSVIGAAIGSTVLGAYTVAQTMKDLIAPVSYPAQGVIGGTGLGVSLCKDFRLKSPLACGAVVATSVATCTTVKTLCIPFAPVIFVINACSIVPMTLVGMGAGAVIGYKSK